LNARNLLSFSCASVLYTVPLFVHCREPTVVTITSHLMSPHLSVLFRILCGTFRSRMDASYRKSPTNQKCCFLVECIVVAYMYSKSVSNKQIAYRLLFLFCMKPWHEHMKPLIMIEGPAELGNMFLRLFSFSSPSTKTSCHR
jgi:hypothetical protein